MIKGLNHITLSTGDLDAAFNFYVDVIGFEPKVRWARGAYLSSSDLWFCLSLSESVHPTEDYSHIAFSIELADLPSFRQRLENAGVTFWQPNSSEGDSLYFLDTDGHKLEVHVGTLESRLDSIRQAPYEGLVFY